MAEFQLPSTETLLRSALSRSAQRGSAVARRRLFLRWLGWSAGQLLRWLVLPALLLAAALSALYHGEPPDLPNRPSFKPPAPPPARNVGPAPGLHLRLDDETLPETGLPAIPAQAQSGASPIVDDRSSRER